MIERYFDILKKKADAKYLSADLAGLIKECEDIVKSCELCEHRCHVNRLKGETGICGVSGAKISSEFLHWGEERELVPSHTIFFSGCNSKCCFCQNWDISQDPDSGFVIEPEKLAGVVRARWKQGAKNVNWVGGDPTPNLLYILKVLKHLDINTPIIWNSNMYMTERTMNILNKVIDLWLTDFKYGNDKCAERLSKLPGYFGVVSRNHKLAEGDVIIRHLVMPNHSDCCSKPILEWISDNLGKETYVNIMDQYWPAYNADKHKDISIRLPKIQFLAVLDHAKKLGFRV